MKTRYMIALLAVSAAAVFALSACAPSAATTPSPTAVVTPEPSLTAKPTETPAAVPASGADSPIAVSYLASLGITAGDLKADLMAHPELIPFGGVLGGTPAFLPDETVILSESWVYARAEDGHVACSILYRYTVGEDKSITWALVGYDLGDGFETEPTA
ncbi:hypothetical protein [Papillibacter cinnamivorans]|uniref:Uncharacterized protein n=1 Tax=Papillibacter cinnamivorans DSM 12816 TaxID=1122930 RepID=A0A1W2A047_9FIRM|nr:hypothetical protein [Papillibacter cinnamivorans]SMC53688.1 hypothetical protein SAMN02745168_1341 [Papillibacter cinnamivorans DSM 12816]